MGKKMKAALTKMEPRPYALREAVALVKNSAYAKFASRSIWRSGWVSIQAFGSDGARDHVPSSWNR